jgi:phosphoribosyl-dephospho-CoA transferase
MIDFLKVNGYSIVQESFILNTKKDLFCEPNITICAELNDKSFEKNLKSIRCKMVEILTKYRDRHYLWLTRYMMRLRLCNTEGFT